MKTLACLVTARIELLPEDEEVGPIVKKRLRQTVVAVCAIILCTANADAYAEMYVLPPTDIDLVGSLNTIELMPDQFPVDIAREYRVGQGEFLAANPALLRFIPIGPDTPKQALLPTRYILPAGDRTGLVVNLAERRLYYYPLAKEPVHVSMVLTYSVSIGQEDWQTPLTTTTVVGRRENPAWYPPESIKQEAEERGSVLPDVVAPGPDNPLGSHAIYLGLPGYLIHGTNQPNDIGMRVTHGCIRMYPEDIAVLFRHVPDGVPVRIVNEPVKVGWHAGTLYIEVHEPLSETNLTDDQLFDLAMQLVESALDERPVTTVNSKMIRNIVETKIGYPVALNVRHPDWPR